MAAAAHIGASVASARVDDESTTYWALSPSRHPDRRPGQRL